VAGSGAGAPALADHPGRPRRPDEVDPELVRLRRRSTRIGPLLAASVLVFSGYTVLSLRADLRFARSGGQPRPVTPADILAGRVATDSHVAVEAVPDRSAVVRVSERLYAEDGHRMAPALGTDRQLWLMLSANPWSEPASPDERYSGRLKRLAELPFAGALRQHFGQRRSWQFLTPDQVQQALATRAAQMRTAAGDLVALAGDTRVEVTETLAGTAMLVCMATESHPDQAAWLAALTAAGILAPEARPRDAARDHWSFAVAAPQGLERLRQVLSQRQLYGVHVMPAVAVRETRWDQLAQRRDALLVAGAPIDWPRVRAVGVARRIDVPEDSWVVITGQHPEAYWYVLPLSLVMGGFALLFGWALALALRAGRRAPG
jgi:hypothetical protein